MSITRLVLFVAAVALAGCPSSSPPPNPPTPTPLPARGAACAAGACGEGLTCVSFVGMAGKPLDVCEIQCGGDGACPTAEVCKDVPDGPQHVCVAGAVGEPVPAQGQPCPAGACAPGLSCVDYYGIAGPNGPKFTSCEIPCKGKTACPDAQKCITIAAGPGEVCRP